MKEDKKPENIEFEYHVTNPRIVGVPMQLEERRGGLILAKDHSKTQTLILKVFALSPKAIKQGLKMDDIVVVPKVCVTHHLIDGKEYVFADYDAVLWIQRLKRPIAKNEIKLNRKERRRKK